MAVFTRAERAIARPTARAAASLTPPTTWISTSFEAPSPSETMARARVRATCSTASSNVFQSAPSRDGSTPEAPPARSRTVSLVLVSPSTEMALKLRSTTRRSSGCSPAGSPTASVVSTASSVAISGWIIPAPLAMPPTGTTPAGVTVGGSPKGAGMIHPDMATLLAVLTTDAVGEPAGLQPLLRRVADRSFNAISVDGDTSTNDTVLLLAGRAPGEQQDGVDPSRDGALWKTFED